MPQPYSSPPPGKRSASPCPSPPEERSSGNFTALPPDSPPDEADSAGEHAPSRSDSLFPPDGSFGATEPFPDGLFRVPIPDEVFGEMPEMSDSALRAHLALIRLSFRFEPEESSWVCPDRTFTRADVQRQSGLSSQGARNGLRELAKAGWVQVDESGRSYEYALEMEVPTSRYTYVPTALLEAASGLSGTELRLVLAVIRATWGWTFPAGEGGEQPSHRRWARLPTSQLAGRTGRSETAVKEAASNLQRRYLERLRPTSGAYHYRFLPEAIMPDEGPAGAPSEETLEETSRHGSVRVEKKIRAFVSVGASNDLTPDRQKSDPSTSYKESSSKDKHGQPQKKKRPEPTDANPPENGHAVPTDNNPGEKSNTQRRRAQSKQPEETSTPDFSDLPPEKQKLAQKLANVGVWGGRIAELLSRFSCTRIRANFELYRQRASEQVIVNPGAWLSQAIIDGYALSPSDSDTPGSTSTSGSLPPLEHKETVSEAKKDAYVAQGIDESRFHRCLSGGRATGEPRFMYFDPSVGTPTSRT